MAIPLSKNDIHSKLQTPWASRIPRAFKADLQNLRYLGKGKGGFRIKYALKDTTFLWQTRRRIQNNVLAVQIVTIKGKF